MKQEAESSELVRKHAEREEERLKQTLELLAEREREIEALKEEHQVSFTLIILTYNNIQEMEARLEVSRGAQFAVQLAESRAQDSMSNAAFQANELTRVNDRLVGELRNAQKVLFVIL